MQVTKPKKNRWELETKHFLLVGDLTETTSQSPTIFRICCKGFIFGRPFPPFEHYFWTQSLLRLAAQKTYPKCVSFCRKGEMGDTQSSPVETLLLLLIEYEKVLAQAGLVAPLTFKFALCFPMENIVSIMYNFAQCKPFELMFSMRDFLLNLKSFWNFQSKWLSYFWKQS